MSWILLHHVNEQSENEQNNVENEIKINTMQTKKIDIFEDMKKGENTPLSKKALLIKKIMFYTKGANFILSIAEKAALWYLIYKFILN